MLYTTSTVQVEKIAKERGEISTGLHALLKEKEVKIQELSRRVKDYDHFMENTEGEFKNRLEKKSKVKSYLKNPTLGGIPETSLLIYIMKQIRFVGDA